MRKRLRKYLETLILLRKDHKDKVVIEGRKGNTELMMMHMYKASTLDNVISDLKQLVEEGANE